ncbi:MAG: hypothetical protein CM1200mP2_42200 [Planctomycetaceae bacterium]|nr:MAG: hypothetical protein CM1200mP2_42200 [Planctomycetaceae bacterium]
MSADYLKQVIESLDGITRFTSSPTAWAAWWFARGRRYRDKRAGRLVMLGVPIMGRGWPIT